MSALTSHPLRYVKIEAACDETVKGSPPATAGSGEAPAPQRRAPRRRFRVGVRRIERAASLALGFGFAALLYVCMALVQMQPPHDPRGAALDETLVAFQPPEIELAPEEPPPPVERDEPPPELAAETPEFTLDQLDLALNPSSGGALLGEVGLGLGGLGGGASLLDEDEFVDFARLDQMPRPIGVVGMNFPQRLLKKKVAGKIVLLLKLDADGRVLDVDVESSDLPDFDDFVKSEVRRWRFTPATQQGRPVKALARLPVPIRISEVVARLPALA
jgi:TonB family protein